jgi:PAS domain S-box-containing protein
MGRVHVVAPAGRDSGVIVATLNDAGIDAVPDTAPMLPSLVNDAMVDAVMIADEALPAIDLAALSRAFEAQPTWSDCPIILLTRKGSSVPPRILAMLENVTILERPLHGDALISAARAALRARWRQRKARDYLLEREAAERKINQLADTLELRVAARTRDLSEAMAQRIAADEKRRESEDLYRTTIELSGLVPWTANDNGQLETVGEGWYAMTGATVEQTIRAGWSNFIHAEDVGNAVAQWSHALATQTRVDVQYRLRQHDGSYRRCRAQGAPLVDPRTGKVRWYGTLEDIDARYAAEDQLRQVQSQLIHVSRLSAMGAMAATLAHELNQPLTAIANYVRGAQRMLASPSCGDLNAVKDALTDAEAGTVRAGEVVRRLRELVARGIVQREPEQLADLINEAARIALLDTGALGIACTFHIDDQIVVLADRIQVQQVVINLLRNSVDAVRGREDCRIKVVAERHDEDSCTVTVHDSGPGVDQAIADRLFTPFFTTKREGMGIGLSISRTIVEANGGQISLQPSQFGGAGFRFTLPLAR